MTRLQNVRRYGRAAPLSHDFLRYPEIVLNA
jgi:hypothetical protein